jgi:LmbE family N-acetylglucosaminyl deacetylase
MNRKIIQTALALLVVSFLFTAPRAQQPATQSPDDRIALYQALLDLTNPWTVMCIAAHPDDEDGTSLIVMRRKYGAHTVSLFSTFGEGGQNAIGPELYEEMGAIRARETMAAAEIQGSEPHFLGLKDFGYSKSADEAFKFWGHDEALRRMVLEIRKLRPDVIITNHSATSNDHGHHQATARLELEAFDAAADPKRFPEQLKDGVTVWQVQRLFVRARGNAQAQANAAPVVTIDPNERDPIRGVVYAEEALRALQKHATQGPWPKTFTEFAARFRAFSGQSAAPGQLPLVRYALVREAKGADGLPKDSHNFLDGLKLPDDIAKDLAPPTIDGRPLTDFTSDHDRVLHSLIVADNSAHEAGPKGAERDRFLSMKQRLFHALAVASGVTVTVTPRDKLLVPGRTSDFVIRISNGGRGTVTPYLLIGFKGGAKGGLDDNSVGPLLPGRTITMTRKYATPADATVNVPPAQHLYDGQLFRRRIEATAFVKIEDATFTVPAETSMDVAAAVEITNISPSPAVKTPPDRKAKLQGTMDCLLRDFNYKVRLTNHQGATLSGQLIVGPGFGRKAAYHPITIGAHDTVDLTVSVPGCPQPSDPKAASEKGNPISFTVVGNGATKPLARLDVPIVFADARVATDLRVGYVRGFDHSLPNALSALGVESKEITLDEVKTANLSKYTSIIVDNRVYESQPELIAANQKLLDYANAGGTLIVFYHKSNEWNPDPKSSRQQQLAPYKLLLGNERITDETAPVTFLEPEHPLLNSPNKIGPDDFKDWIQERGLYYSKEWDPQFHALLQSNDPGEAPLKGGLLVADYGRGHYIYTSMVWYRELRGGIPGAYRMLANMISYGQAGK